jgi:hypothetical protein
VVEETGEWIYGERAVCVTDGFQCDTGSLLLPRHLHVSMIQSSIARIAALLPPSSLGFAFLPLSMTAFLLGSEGKRHPPTLTTILEVLLDVVCCCILQSKICLVDFSLFLFANFVFQALNPGLFPSKEERGTVASGAVLLVVLYIDVAYRSKLINVRERKQKSLPGST